MKVWLGEHRVAGEQYAVELSGCEAKKLADARVASSLREAWGDEQGSPAPWREGCGGARLRAFASAAAQLLLQTWPDEGRALLVVCSLGDARLAARGVEAFLLRLQPAEAALIGLPEGGGSGRVPYPPEGAFFVRTLARCQSAFQTIEVGEHPVFGRMLFLNGETQIASSDEALYSASLVGPAMQEGTRRVCILGGGDCGVLREVLSHPVDEVVMVEIDGEVVETASEYFPEVVGGARQDPRATIVIGDAFAYVAEHGGFDLIIYDLSDTPLGVDTYDAVCRSIHAALAPGGRVAVQCGSGLPMYAEGLRAMQAGLERHFQDLRSERVVVPSFLDQPWVFSFGTRRGD